MEISTGPDQEAYDLFKTGDQVLAVDPWRFEENHFEVSVESRLIPELKFSDAYDFRKALTRQPLKPFEMIYL